MKERPILTENARLIESYYYLHQEGIFTDQEFEEIKKHLLGRDLGREAEPVQKNVPPEAELHGETGKTDGRLSENRRKTKNCAVCGKEFAGYSASRYCSQACRERARAEKKAAEEAAEDTP